VTVDYETRRQLAERLRVAREGVAEAATDEFLERHPDWLERYGDAARIRGEEDAAYHVDFLAGALVADDPEAYATYARWTAGVLSSRGIAPVFLAENLDQVRRAAADRLDGEERALVDRFVEAGIAALEEEGPEMEPAEQQPFGEEPSFGAEPSFGTEPSFGAERSLYLQAVRSGDRRAALNVTLESIRAGVSVPEVYRQVLQPAQYEIGRLWARNEITVAREHMATAITQYVVAQLYSHLDLPEASRGRALVTGVRGELHQLGANMVADVLEADGWNTRFLGTQLPHGGILEAVEEHEPQLIGISATVLSNLPAVAELIGELRARFGSEVVILVGGAAFTGQRAWREMGADGVGRDLEEAVARAAELTPDQEV
jgi:methanogenic corrinoid protein MtbC1